MRKQVDSGSLPQVDCAIIVGGDAMRGQVLQAGTNGGDGVILGSDGNRYSFTRADWKGVAAPLAGDEVDFIATDGRAEEIYPLPAQRAAATPAVAAAQTEGSSVMLGTIGILCLVLGFMIPVLPTVVAFIVGLVGADSAKRHGNSTGLLLSRISWIGALIMFLAGIVLIVLAMTFAWPMLDILWQYIEQVMREETARSALLAI